MLGGLSLDVLGIRHHNLFGHGDLKLLTLFVVDDLPVHDRESTSSIGFLGAQHLAFEGGEGEGVDNQGVSEHEPLDILVAGGLSVTAHVHEPTVAHTVVLQNAGDVHLGVNAHLSIEVLFSSLGPLQQGELFQPQVVLLDDLFVLGVLGSSCKEVGS